MYCGICAPLDKRSSVLGNASGAQANSQLEYLGICTDSQAEQCVLLCTII